MLKSRAYLAVLAAVAIVVVSVAPAFAQTGKTRVVSDEVRERCRAQVRAIAIRGMGGGGTAESNATRSCGNASQTAAGCESTGFVRLVAATNLISNQARTARRDPPREWRTQHLGRSRSNEGRRPTTCRGRMRYQQRRHQHRYGPQTRVNPGRQYGPHPRQATCSIGVKFCAAELMSLAPREVCAAAVRAADPASSKAIARVRVALCIVSLSSDCLLSPPNSSPARVRLDTCPAGTANRNRSPTGDDGTRRGHPGRHCGSVRALRKLIAAATTGRARMGLPAASLDRSAVLICPYWRAWIVAAQGGVACPSSRYSSSQRCCRPAPAAGESSTSFLGGRTPRRGRRRKSWPASPVRTTAARASPSRNRPSLPVSKVTPRSEPRVSPTATAATARRTSSPISRPRVSYF